TAKITNFKLNKSGVAGIQPFQAKEYSKASGFIVIVAPDINLKI
ncbi:MAG: hypothetical protein RL769_111, partial [Pseudomonadota bacterium]